MVQGQVNHFPWARTYDFWDCSVISFVTQDFYIYIYIYIYIYAEVISRLYKVCCITDVWLGKYMFTPWFCIIVEAVPWLRCQPLTLRSPRFVPGPDHMGFVVDMRHWGRFLSEYLGFLLSMLCRQCSILIFCDVLVVLHKVCQTSGCYYMRHFE